MLKILVHPCQQPQLCSENNPRAGMADLCVLVSQAAPLPHTSSSAHLFSARVPPQSELS